MYSYVVNGVEVATDYKVQSVAELRQEIAMKLGESAHVFSRTLWVDGEPLRNLKRSIYVHGRQFTLKR